MASNSNSTPIKIRPAKKAGSWYTKDASALTKELKIWLGNSSRTINNSNKRIKAIICPHAGYMYCGGTAAYSYHHVDPLTIKRVFILGPDHCGAAYSSNNHCMLSSATHWQTPFGNINVDTNIVKQLYNTKYFDMLSMKDDANEHSLELIVPFLSYMFYSHYNSNNNTNNNDNDDNDVKIDNGSGSSSSSWNASFKIIPIMVGNCSSSSHKLYGKILSSYFNDPSTLFIISSDFCHWGNNYGYTPFDQDNYDLNKIYKYIRDLDFLAIKYIEKLNYKKFYKYLNDTQNTICGQHPICILLNIISYINNNNNNNNNNNSNDNDEYEIKFVNYSQSSKVTNLNEYSVSYASGILYQKIN